MQALHTPRLIAEDLSAFDPRCLHPSARLLEGEGEALTGRRHFLILRERAGAVADKRTSERRETGSRRHQKHGNSAREGIDALWL